MNRPRLYALIHAGAKAMGMDDATRRDWMQKLTGKRSCSDCTETELARLGEELRRLGFAPLPRSAPPGGTGPNRPTVKQWALAAKLARKKGFAWPDDPRLVAHCRRVAKVDHPRFLDSHAIRALIVSLDRWLEWEKTHPKPTNKAKA